MEIYSKQTSAKSLIIIIFLLVLRFPLLYLGELEIVPQEIAFVFYLCVTYLLSGLFIYQNKGDLSQYNITPMALIILLGAPLAALIAGNDYDPTLWIRLVMAVLFLIFLLLKGKYRFNFAKTNVKKVFIDISLTILLCVAVPIIVHAIRGFPTIEITDSTPSIITFDVSRIWLYQLSSAAISEEPLFRGFLWGFLKSKGIKDIWVCIIQAALFWIGHIYYIGNGINFWIIHPMIALLLGLLVWKTKSITHTMILHSSINTFTDYLRHIPFL